VNQNSVAGNPTLHGEMVAIGNCTDILTDPNGPYALSPTEASAAWADFTLYTNAESCPMCASAIRWAGFKEYVYGTSIDQLIETGWGQIDIASSEVFKQSWNLGTSTKFVSEVLTNETDPYFLWQFQTDYPCPGGCSRGDSGRCQED
jgi:tRNA(Arg) A34 adenosine deaminase TadA